MRHCNYNIFPVKKKIVKQDKEYHNIIPRTFRMRNNIGNNGNAFPNRQADLGYLAKPKKNSDDVSSGRNAIAIAYLPI